VEIPKYKGRHFEEILLAVIIIASLALWWATREIKLLDMFAFGAFTALLGMMRGLGTKRPGDQNGQPD
jgi:hypothetical protein